MQAFNIPSEDAMLELGNAWANCIGDGAVVFLDGDLGAGKTTLARGILRGMGHRGAVTSPTYTLVEHYAPGGRDVYHFDLYRLEDPAELEMTGLRDLLDGRAVLLVEWPERGAGCMPSPDLRIDIRHHGDARRVCIGVSVSVKLDPGADGQGWSLSLSPGYGRTAAGWQDIWDNGLLKADDAEHEGLQVRLQARAGYGVKALTDTGLVTPYSELSSSPDKRSYRLGVQWQTGARFDLDVSARRTDEPNKAPHDDWLLKAQLRF